MAEPVWVVLTQAADKIEGMVPGTTTAPWFDKPHPDNPEWRHVTFGKGDYGIFSSSCCGGHCPGFVDGLVAFLRARYDEDAALAVDGDSRRNHCSGVG